MQFAFRQCSSNRLCEEEPEPIPQITCSLIQASRCSIDTVVRTLDPNELIINCNRRGRQGDHSAPQCTDSHVCLSVTPKTHICIIYIILNWVIHPGGRGPYFCVDMATNSGRRFTAPRFVLLMRLSFVHICSANVPRVPRDWISSPRGSKNKLCAYKPPVSSDQHPSNDILLIQFSDWTKCVETSAALINSV